MKKRPRGFGGILRQRVWCEQRHKSSTSKVDGKKAKNKHKQPHFGLLYVLFTPSCKVPESLPLVTRLQTNCGLASLLGGKPCSRNHGVLCPGIPEGQGLGYARWVSEHSAGTLICGASLLCGMWRKVSGWKALAFYFTADLATGDVLDFVERGLLITVGKGRDTPSLRQSLACIPQRVFSPSLSLSLC